MHIGQSVFISGYMKDIIIVIFCTLLTSCGYQCKPTEQEQELISQIESVFEVRQQLAERYWPAFDDERFSAPVLFFADTLCYAVNPTERFLNEFKCERIKAPRFDLYKTKRLDSAPFHMEMYMNLDTYLKGSLVLCADTTLVDRTPYVMCSTLGETRKMFDDISDEKGWIPMVIHELAHGCQYFHPNHYLALQSIKYPISTLDFVEYATKYEWLGEALVTENEHLLSAIATDNNKEMNEHIREFLSCRKSRKEKMKNEFGEDIVNLEEMLERCESLGRYMEVQSAQLLGNDDPKYAEDSLFFSENVRQAYFFVTGYNLIRLFIKLGIDLDLPYQSTEHKALEEYI